jgi:hypothetical protein
MYMKTSEELSQLANDVIQNRTYMTTDPMRMGLSFSVILGLMSPEDRQMLIDADVVAVYASYAEAGPVSINGLPMFYSASFLTREEYKIFYATYAEKRL